MKPTELVDALRTDGLHHYAEQVAVLVARTGALEAALKPFAVEGSCDPMCSEGCAYCDAVRALRGPSAPSVGTPSPVPNEDMLEELRKHGMITRQPSGGVLTWMMHEAGVDKLHERFPFTDEHRAALKAFAAHAPIPATRPCPHVTIMVNGACLACGVVPTGSGAT